MTKIIFLDMDGVLNSMPDKEVEDTWIRYVPRKLYLDDYGIEDIQSGEITEVCYGIDDAQMKCDSRNERIRQHKLYGIDPDLAKNLKVLLDRTNAKIVFSTSWRYFKDHHIEGSDWRKSLADCLGVSTDIFLGNTPDLFKCGGWDSASSEHRVRGSEIKLWIENHPEFAQPGNYRFCAIDDEVSDIIPVIGENHVIHTDYKTGIQMKDVDRAVKILNGD